MSSVSGTSICTARTCSALHIRSKIRLPNRSACRSWVPSLPRKWSIRKTCCSSRHPVHDPVELAEALRRGPERLLVHHPGALGEPVLAEPLGDLAERGRRDGEVVQVAGVLRRGPSSPSRITSSRLPACSFSNPPPANRSRWENSSQGPSSGFGPNSVSASCTAPLKSSCETSPRPFPMSSHFPGISPCCGELVERRQHHPPGQVAGRPEQHEQHGIVCVVVSHGSTLPARRNPQAGRCASAGGGTRTPTPEGTRT